MFNKKAGPAEETNEGAFSVWRHVYDRSNTGQPSFPSRLRRPSASSPLEVSEDGTVLTHTGRNPGKEVAVQSSTHFAVTAAGSPGYYFEVTIDALAKEGVLAIGLAEDDFPAEGQFPGWKKNSYGFHSDDGNIYVQNGKGTKYSTPYAAGDVIGCYVSTRSALSFTRNGAELGSTPLPVGNYYPTIGVDASAQLQINFGQHPYKFAQTPYATLVAAETLRAKLEAKRYVTHITLDKPIYRPKDTMYFRGWVLDAHDQSPVGQQLANSLKAKLQIFSPADAEVYSTALPGPVSGAVAGSWTIPDGTAGGNYRAKVSYPQHNLPSAERVFNIRQFSTPRMKMQLEFVKKGYGPGDEAEALLEVSRAEGGVPAKAAVTAEVTLDGSTVYQGSGQIDDNGKYTVKFTLPRTIERGEGTLTCTINDGGVVESTGQTVPVLLRDIDMTFFPESGDLVALPNQRIYVEAFTPAGGPADFSGEIIDESGLKVGFITTAHEGRGRGTFNEGFIPKAGHQYSVRVTAPSGITKLKELPAVKADGAFVSSDSDVYTYDTPLALKVGATTSGRYRVSVCKKNLEVTSAFVAIGESGGVETLSLSLPTSTTCDGVLRVTVFGDNGIPLAERLVLRRPKASLGIKVIANKQRYSPGEKVKLRVFTYDENGVPVRAHVGVAVTDDTVLEMVQRREQAPRLPAMAVFESDVAHLEDAHVYLDPAHPLSELAADLLLGTQGWRRFAFVYPEEYVKLAADADGDLPTMGTPAKLGKAKNKQAAERLLAFAHAEEAVELSSGSDESEDDDEEEEERARPLFRRMVNRARNEEVKMKKAPQKRGKMMQKEKEQVVMKQEVEMEMDMAMAAEMDIPRPIREKEMKAPLMKRADKGDMQEKKKMKKKVMAKKKERRLPRFDEDELLVKAPRSLPQVVRVYAHKRKAPYTPGGERSDFTETLYWTAATTTELIGSEDLEFELNDSITTFKVWVEGVSVRGGLLCATSTLLTSVNAFYVEYKLPIEVTSGDEVSIPFTVVNTTNDDLKVALFQKSTGPLTFTQADKGKAAEAEFAALSLPAGPLVVPQSSRARTDITTVVDRGVEKAQQAMVTLKADAGKFEDTVTRETSVVPNGFPFQFAAAGLLPKNGSVKHSVVLPKEIDMSTLKTNVVFYLNPMGNLTQALAALVREPYGCFEQTSSVAYPMTMAQQYFQCHQGADAKVVEQARKHLATSYKRLTGFEVKEGGKLSGGFDWFGEPAASESLTAYGLLEFSDMSQVHPVEPQLIERVKTWLLSRRDGKGQFMRGGRALDDFGRAPVEITNAYICWALSEAKLPAESFAKELDHVLEEALKSEKSKDPYFLGLTALALYNVGRKSDGDSLSQLLVALQNENGAVHGAHNPNMHDTRFTSITCSYGEGLLLEASSLAILAWIKGDAKFRPNVEQSMQWVASKCKDGRFGSTQSTILALKAIIEYDLLKASPEAGELGMVVNGEVAAKVRTDDAEREDKNKITLPSFAHSLKAGQDNELELYLEGGAEMPYSIAITYFTPKPDNHDNCRVRLSTTLKDTKLVEGQGSEIRVALKNVDDKDGQPMTLAIVGLPGGLEPRHDQLKELVKAKTIAYYEVIGREVCCYFRQLQPSEEVQFRVDVVARIPGVYTGPASRAYLYYTNEEKHWNDPLAVTIAPAQQ